MKVNWIGTASVVISTEHTKILFDPYNQPFQKAFTGFTQDEMADIDAVFITHPHLDHFGDISYFMERIEAPFYVCRRGYDLARRNGIPADQIKVIEPHDILTINDLQIHVFQGKHCTLEKKQLPAVFSRIDSLEKFRNALKLAKQNYHDFVIGERDIFTYGITDGNKWVFLMGSAGICSKDLGITEPDTLIYPYQGKLDMCSYSEELLKQYHPAQIILSHFDDAFPPLTADMNTEEFIEHMKQNRPEIEIIRPERGVSYEV